jgi:hypothetical protein
MEICGWSSQASQSEGTSSAQQYFYYYRYYLIFMFKFLDCTHTTFETSIA